MSTGLCATASTVSVRDGANRARVWAEFPMIADAPPAEVPGAPPAMAYRVEGGSLVDPEAERQLCRFAERDHGVAAVFVLGFPLAARPFYTHPRTETTAAGFDLLFDGIEITTGGQRLHRRSDLEHALGKRGISPAPFESHLKMFELGMPPHGGLAIGLERLTAQILGLQNVREATLYPRDRYRVTP